MSNSAIRAILTFCLVVAVAVALKVLPKPWLERAVERTREMAGQITSPANQPAGGPTTRPAAGGAPPMIDRAAYRITLPANATVDPDDSDVDREHYATANLPGGGALILLVVDDKALAGPHFDNIVTSLQAKLDKPLVGSTHTFDSINATRSTAITGVFKGEAFDYEIGQIEGPKKACLMILEYPDDKKAQTLEMMRGPLAAFQMKQ